MTLLAHTLLLLALPALTAACYRGLEVGREYAYAFDTALFYEKTHMAGGSAARTHRRDLAVHLEARLQPEAALEDGALLVALQLDAAHLEDLEGWQAYDGDGGGAAIDPTAADAQLLEMLQHDFYFHLHCDMSVSDVHYDTETPKFAVNMKNLLVSSFSHQLNLAADASADDGLLRYTQEERDALGAKQVAYEHSAAPDDSGMLHVTTRHDGARATSMRVKGVTSTRDQHRVDLDQTMVRRAQFRDGVVHALHLEQSHQYPGKATRDEMEADARQAENTNHAQNDAMQDSAEHRSHTDTRDEPDERFAASSNGFSMSAGGTTRVTLSETRKRRLRAAEPRHVRSFADYATVRHGDEVRFVHSVPHHLLMDADVHERVRSASDEALPAEQLAALTIDGERGHHAWRTLLHRLDGAERDATLAELRRLLNLRAVDDDDDEEEEEEGEEYEEAEFDVDAEFDSASSLPEDARPHLLSLLSEHGDEQCEMLLFDVAEAAADMSTDRHAAMLALARLREPSVALTERFEAKIKHCDVHQVFCRQLLLDYGAMASTLHHAEQAQRAHNMRELLFVRLDQSASVDDREGATILAIALNNTMAFVDENDASLYNVTIGHWLNQEWGSQAREHLYEGNVAWQTDEENERSVYECQEDDPKNCQLRVRKRAMAPAPPLALGDLLGGNSGTSGWKKWYEGWSFSSRKNEYLPKGGQTRVLGKDEAGGNWAVPSDTPGEPQYGLNGINKDGKAKKQGLLTRCKGSYQDGTPCASKHYDNYVPRRPDKGWKKKLGSGKFYAMLEAALHKRAEGSANQRNFFFKLDFFAGAQFSASLMGKKVPILSAYARANVSISDEREKCSYFDIGLFYYYFGKMFFWGIGSTDCQFVDSTCKPWFPVDRSKQGYLEFAHEVFFEQAFQFALGPIPMVVFIEGVGGAGMYYSVDMIFAPALKDKYGNECGGIDDGGGSMVNGFCEPEAYVSLAAELGIGIAVLSAGIGIQVDIIRVSLPASAGLNFVTRRPCFGIGVSVGALGGRIYLWARIGLCKGWIKICIRLKKTIYDWRGLTWEKPLLRVDCCKPCPGACNNAWCDYRHGKCICNDEWGGPLCNMNCPRDCLDIETINPGVQCEINPDPEAHTEICECKNGYYGWNCLIPCPGIREGDPEPRMICSGHGQCGSYGYQTSTGFGVDNSVENTLVAACLCDHNYFGELCDITCPADPDTGRVCGGGGGVCVYDGSKAFCQCLKGYAGPECKARCPLFRGSPCGFRGDCLWEQGRATCHCHLGFSGQGCEHVDELGGGRALRFVADNLYYVEVPDATTRLQSAHNQYTFGLWFRPDALPQGIATLLTWRWGRILLSPDQLGSKRQTTTAALLFCDNRIEQSREGCITSTISVNVGSSEWQYVFATSSSYQLAHDKQLWHGVPAVGGACSNGGELQPRPFNGWCVADIHKHENSDFVAVPGTFRVGLNYTGLIDNIEIFGDRPTTAVVNARAHHLQAPDDTALLFAALCDEGRGDTIYDEHAMLSGRFVFPDEFDWLAAGPEYIWANPSGVELEHGSIYSNVTDPFSIGNGTVSRQWFHTDLRATRVNNANLHFTWAVPTEQMCEVNVVLHSEDGDTPVPVVDENGRKKMFNGQGTDVVPLSGAIVSKLRTITSLSFSTAADTVSTRACFVELDEVFLEAAGPVADTILEFTGRPSAYAATTQHKKLKLPFTIEMWLIRPPLLRSNRGLLMSLVDKSADATFAAVDGPFLLYETGFPSLGMQYKYEGKSQKVLAGGHDQGFGATGYAPYTVPSDEWVHFAVTVEKSPTPNKCLHTFYINGRVGPSPDVGSRNGVGERLDYPGLLNEQTGVGTPTVDKPNHCDPNAYLQGWGNPQFELRLGSKFLGAINDVIIWPSAVSPLQLRQNMHRLRPLNSLPALHAYDFGGVMKGGEKGDPVIVPDRKGGANLEMRDGAHLGLVLAVEHEWRHCPGVTYQLPEAVCGSEPSHAHGTCLKPRGQRERRQYGEDPTTREKGYECECHEGYRAGVDGECSVECPGGFANPCSGHGRCVGAVAPIEVWENEDGTVNETYTDPSDPNTYDRRQPEEAVCVCDEGYVGAACEFECPGWSEPWNRPQRICSGYGFCNHTITGGATCQCFDSSQRYGDACEFAYGSKPELVVSECGPCEGDNEHCVDAFCSCVDGFYRVFGQCRPHVGELDVKDNTVATFAAFFSVLAVCLICFAVMAIVYLLKFR